jgi:bifunctional DNA-binding transcriptional regulator/antitoxin component of YhaV-PrlF toxin-antitoxin module
MKTKTFFSLAFILITGACFSQKYVTQIKSVETHKWGYANEKGQIIIPAQYDRCNEFTSDGWAAVFDKKSKLFSFINVKGEKLQTQFVGFELLNASGFGVEGVVEGFNCGLAAVKTRDWWGFLNTNGKVVIGMKFDETTIFYDGYAVAKSGNKYIVLDTNGKESPVTGHDIVGVKHFSEKLAPYWTTNKDFGFIDENGKIVIPAKFKSVGYFKNGLAWAKTDKLLGYINPKGEWVIKPQFEVGKEFDKEAGLARIKLDGRWGYVNRSGKITYVSDTEWWSDFSEGLAEGREGGMRGFYNDKGDWIIKPQFEGVRSFKNGYAAAKMRDLWGMIDKKGNWVIGPSFLAIKDMELVR